MRHCSLVKFADGHLNEAMFTEDPFGAVKWMLFYCLLFGILSVPYFILVYPYYSVGFIFPYYSVGLSFLSMVYLSTLYGWSVPYYFVWLIIRDICVIMARFTVIMSRFTAALRRQRAAQPVVREAEVPQLELAAELRRDRADQRVVVERQLWCGGGWRWEATLPVGGCDAAQGGARTSRSS